jgi:RNA polymerase sigma-70 factor (ECF subfamily)
MIGKSAVALVRQAQLGEVIAFEQLVAEHLPFVRRYARAFAHTKEAAEDLAQDALVKAYRSLASYRFQASFRTWLSTIVRNEYLDRSRRRDARARALERPLDETMVIADLPEDSPRSRADLGLEREQMRRAIWAALATIPADYRSSLVLYDIEGFSHHEIAAIEGVAIGTVKSRISRGRERLRGALSRLASSEGLRRPTTPGRIAERQP